VQGKIVSNGSSGIGTISSLKRAIGTVVPAAATLAGSEKTSGPGLIKSGSKTSLANLPNFQSTGSAFGINADARLSEVDIDDDLDGMFNNIRFRNNTVAPGEMNLIKDSPLTEYFDDVALIDLDGPGVSILGPSRKNVNDVYREGAMIVEIVMNQNQNDVSAPEAVSKQNLNHDDASAPEAVSKTTTTTNNQIEFVPGWGMLILPMAIATTTEKKKVHHKTKHDHHRTLPHTKKHVKRSGRRADRDSIIKLDGDALTGSNKLGNYQSQDQQLKSAADHKKNMTLSFKDRFFGLISKTVKPTNIVKPKRNVESMRLGDFGHVDFHDKGADAHIERLYSNPNIVQKQKSKRDYV